MNDPAPVRALHWSTIHGERPAHPERLLPFRPLDPSNRPAPFKTYPGLGATPLPRRLVRSSPTAIEVLSGRRAGASPLTEERLSTLLFLAGGVTRFTVAGDGEPVYFRTAMSAGNLHPVEMYTVSASSVAYYHPLEHALVTLRGVAPDTAAEGSATVVLTGVPFRTCWKYGERGWRHLWWDAGTMLANLLAAADALGVEARVVTGFPDASVAELVGVNGVDEAPLCLVALGPAQEGPVPQLSRFGPLRGEAGPLAPRPLRFPLVTEAHGASVLDAASVAPWLAALASAASPAPEVVDPPRWPRAQQPVLADRVEDVILRRGSTRLFDPGPVPEELLHWGLVAATRAVPGDAAPGATLLEHLVSVHGVEGMAPGAYRYTGRRGFEPAGHPEPDGFEPAGGDDARQSPVAARRSPVAARRAAARLCLDQPLGGDSAFTAFQAAELDRLLQIAGARAYRAAHLEAGIVAGRLSLNATALGSGATGLTFYDAAVAGYFNTTALPLLATAVGRPETSPAPSGTPGRPAALSGYAGVSARLFARLNRR